MNLIGDHTDYAGGLVLPMAIEWGTTVDLERGGPSLELWSETEAEPAVVPIEGADPARAVPSWARYVAAVVAVVGPDPGGRGTVSTNLPVGAGLSSSAALELALALALGLRGRPAELARACQEAERLAVGVPCGIMDPLVSAAGVAGHGLLIDCGSLDIRPVAVPAGLDVVVVHSGQDRALAGSAYARRRAECEAAARLVGPLPRATPAEVAGLADPVLRRRALHVATECARVRAFAERLEAGDAAGAGALMSESHASLRDDFEVSTPALDAVVARLASTPGVYGARLTGAGFGGCAVALAEAGAPVPGWHVRPSAGARVQEPPTRPTQNHLRE